MDVIYHPLPDGAHIRLLEVVVDPTSRELVCSFRVISLEPCTHSYNALSYAWEDPKPVSRLKFSNGRSLPLSATLSKLFGALRKRHETFNVWIDALCINQKNDTEKASQVVLMGKVYSCAEQVLLWLGDSTVETSTAFRFMESKKHLSWPEGWEEEEDLSGLDSMFAMLALPWFQRVWVIQEVTLNDKVCMVCGDDLADFPNLLLCVSAVWKFGNGLGDYESPAMRGLFCATRLVYLQEEYQGSGPVRYETLLQAAFHCQASDRRDMVFAFRGIADNDRPVPEPDYTASIEDVCVKTAIALLCHGDSLDLLALCGFARNQQMSNLPTWVPDLRYHSFDEPYVLSDGAAWDAGGDIQVSPTFIAPDQLRIQGQLFDTVEATSSIFDSNSVTAQRNAVQEILDWRERLPHEESEDAWLDIMAQSLTHGLDIEDDAMDLDRDRVSFRECVRLLQASPGQEIQGQLSKNRYYRTMGPKVDGWKAYLTGKGHLCIGPPDVRASDFVYTVPGCCFPLVLRWDPKGSDSEPLFEFVLVSWCFVYGLMSGEKMGEKGPVEEILLR